MEAAIGGVAGMLGVGVRDEPLDPLALIASIERGLPVEVLDRVARAIAPSDERIRYAFVPRATLARRTRAKRLSADESAKVARVARVYARAQEAWGSDDEARAFLYRPHPLFGDRRPFDVALATDLGAQLVEQTLGRLIHGTAA